MTSLGVLIAVVAVLFATMPAAIEQWRTDRAGFIKTLKLAGLYVLYVAAGVAGLVLLADRQAPSDGPEAARGAMLLTGAITAWILYGGLILLRVVPRYREPPAWLARFGVADVVLLVLFLGCLIAFARG